MGNGETLVNSILGAIVTAILATVVPLAPILGGMVAGYLEGGDRQTGVRVGIYAGLIAVIPLLLLLVIFGSVVFAMMGMSGPGMPWALGGAGLSILVFGFLMMTVYTVGFSALGGWLGNYVRQDTDIGA